MPLPERFDQMVQSWDLAFKDVATSDYVVGQVWGTTGADRYLLDQRRDRWDLPHTLQAIRELSDKWPQATAKLVEDKANGPAVIASLQHEIGGLIAVNPEGGKMARAAAVSPQIEAGNIYLPHPSIAPWVDGLIEECTSFPRARHDDQVDAMTQALHRLHLVSTAVYPVAESEIVLEPFLIPEHWPRAFGMEIRWNETAALWGARDPSTDILYVQRTLAESGAASRACARDPIARRMDSRIH